MDYNVTKNQKYIIYILRHGLGVPELSHNEVNIRTARIVCLVWCDWGFKKSNDVFQKLILEEKYKVAPIDQHVGPLLGFYSQKKIRQERKVLLSTLRVI